MVFMPEDVLHDSPTVPLGGSLDDSPMSFNLEGRRYDTQGMLGEGGMGEVTLRRDRRIGRDIAMKVMRSDAADRPDLRSRFVREALLQGRLEHPSIVPVYDVGLDESGAAYFTMKRVRGRTLTSVLESLSKTDPETVRAFSRHKLLTSFASACLAVEFAHARGVVHRDLKPDNIMLGDFGEVYVLDWGIAKIDQSAVSERSVERPSAGPPAATEHGTVLGTPGYMAPEQIESSAEVDARADVYALGAVLFEILALRPLHEGSTAGDRVLATLRGCDARPSRRAPDRNVPPELDAICVKATAREKSDRYASARELHDALERFLEGDRDLELRRALSREHAARGSEAAAHATTPAVRPARDCEREEALAPEAFDSRATALRELGRALVLDPSNTDALDGLMKLLTSEPRELPRVVRERIAEENKSLLRVRAKWGAVGYGGGILGISLLGVAIRVPWLVAAMTVTWLAAALGYARVYRRPPADGATPILVQILAALAIAGTSSYLGPLVLVPTVGVATVYGMALGARPSSRWVAAVIMCLAIAIPWGLEAAGLVPPSYALSPGALRLLPRAMYLGPLTLWFLFAVSLFAIVTVSILAGNFRRELTRMQRSVHLQAWQLRQLLPKDSGAERAR
jgi:eukaryotic-like serine/threonine-protein kinase